jgi:hypothetical protein
MVSWFHYWAALLAGSLAFVLVISLPHKNKPKSAPGVVHFYFTINGRHEDQRPQDPKHFSAVQHHQRGRSEAGRTISRHPPKGNRRHSPNRIHGHNYGHNFRCKGEGVGEMKMTAFAKCLKLNWRKCMGGIEPTWEGTSPPLRI